jgi:hypothetical protein
MIELHYGHLQPAQKANVIAGKCMGSKKKAVSAEDEYNEAEQSSKWLPKPKIDS